MCFLISVKLLITPDTIVLSVPPNNRLIGWLGFNGTFSTNRPYHAHTHTLRFKVPFFPGEPRLAGCPLNSPSFVPGLCILLGHT